MLGIICAMEIEARSIKEKFCHVTEKVYFDKKFYCGSLNGKQAVLCVSGIGKVNAAISAVLLTEKFAVTVILNIGVAGSVDSTLKQYETVVGESAMQHDFDLSESDKLSRGQLPQFDSPFIPLEKKYYTKLEKKGFKTGRLATTDTFKFSKENLAFLVESNVLCEDMEIAAIAQVCALCNVPVVSAKTVSNTMSATGTKEYTDCLEDAVKAMSAVFDEIVEVIYDE